jgi:hypothetical protein
MPSVVLQGLSAILGSRMAQVRRAVDNIYQRAEIADKLT